MIIYYTGTENSKYVAEAAKDLLDDEIVDCRPYLKENRKGEFVSQKPYVFCSPTYSWRLPVIFSDFIKESRFEGNQEAYFIMTCGDSVGNAAAYIQRLCQEKGLHFRGLLPIVMPENYLALFPVPEKKTAEKIIASSLPKLKAGLELILGQKDLEPVKGGLLGKFCSGPVNVIYRKLIVKSGPFRSTDACIGCGACVRNCVTNNITLKNQRPLWGKNCIHCMACICGCPVEAIEYGKSSVNRPRYWCEPYQGELKNRKE